MLLAFRSYCLFGFSAPPENLYCHSPQSPSLISPTRLQVFKPFPSCTSPSSIIDRSDVLSVLPNMPLPNEHSLPCESQSQSEETQAPTLQAPGKKRNRFNKTQTSVLEQYFTQDHSPSAARQKEISELIRCSIRQTQVWFQNRYGCSLGLASLEPQTIYTIDGIKRRGIAEYVDLHARGLSLLSSSLPIFVEQFRMTLPC